MLAESHLARSSTVEMIPPEACMVTFVLGKPCWRRPSRVVALTEGRISLGAKSLARELLCPIPKGLNMCSSKADFQGTPKWFSRAMAARIGPRLEYLKVPDGSY